MVIATQMAEVEPSRESTRSYVKSRKPCTGRSHKSHPYESKNVREKVLEGWAWITFGYPELLQNLGIYVSGFGPTFSVAGRYSLANDVSLRPVANEVNVNMISNVRTGVLVRRQATYFSVIMVCRWGGTERDRANGTYRTDGRDGQCISRNKIKLVVVGLSWNLLTLGPTETATVVTSCHSTQANLGLMEHFNSVGKSYCNVASVIGLPVVSEMINSSHGRVPSKDVELNKSVQYQKPS
ncbi:hypothetical protein BDR03DRAFT_980681 [Suillus americanus]|nr:hypothetical protein BDR03DRAFT_980681 [Suillus americanus]